MLSFATPRQLILKSRIALNMRHIVKPHYRTVLFVICFCFFFNKVPSVGEKKRLSRHFLLLRGRGHPTSRCLLPPVEELPPSSGGTLVSPLISQESAFKSVTMSTSSASSNIVIAQRAVKQLRLEASVRRIMVGPLQPRWSHTGEKDSHPNTEVSARLRLKAFAGL